MPGWGGKREGAGRPRKENLYRSEIREAERKVADKLTFIADRMLDLASGIIVQEEDGKTGEMKVYQRPPDRQAIEYLWNRLAGKPSEHMELDADMNVTGGDSSDHLTAEQRAAVRAALFGRSAGEPGRSAGSSGDS